MIEKTFLKTTAVAPPTKGNRTPALAVFLSLMLGAVSAAGQTAPATPPPPEAESLLDAFVEKCGGRAIGDQIVNRRSVSSMTMSQFPAPGEVTTFVTKAGEFRCVIQSPAFGKIEYGSDGKTVWEITPMAGPKIKSGTERKRFQSLYALDPLMLWRDVFKRVEFAGLEPVGGRPAYKVIAVNRDDYAAHCFFDQGSGLLVKIEYPIETAAGRGVQEIFLDDYRNVAGMLFPYRQVRKEFGRDMTLIFTRVEYNVEIPEGTFTLPEAIRKISAAQR